MESASKPSFAVWLGLVSVIFLLRVWHAQAEEMPRKELGTFEKQALALALAKLKRKVDPAPQGKTLGAIHVVNLDVFLPSDGGFLRWFNRFHRTSRDSVVRREILLEPGQTWSQNKIEETERKLRDTALTNLVVIQSLQTDAEGIFDLLVVTRDVWSLRLNSNFELQSTTISKLEFSLSENNFLGWRKQLALRFAMNQGSYSIGPVYLDRNIAGTRLQLSATAAAIFERSNSSPEGSSSATVLTYPFWSLDRKWSGAVRIGHNVSVARVFQGVELLTYDAPETAEDDAIPHEYRRREFGIETTATHSIGKHIIHRFTLGHDFDIQRFRVRSDFGRTEELRDAFERDVLPRSERTSAILSQYHLFTPSFTKYYNVATYDLAEDIRLGPELSFTLAPVLELIGSDTNHLRLGGLASYTLDIASDGFLRVSASAGGRYQDDKWIDNRVDGSFRLVVPKLANVLRFVARFSSSAYFRETQNRFFTVGGQTGLRGYAIGEFRGRIRMVGNLELRTSPLAYGFLRYGALAFWDVGHAAEEFSDLNPRHDIGAGLRALVPQSGSFVYRLDWAFALQGRSRGWPGRITAGVSQVF